MDAEFGRYATAIVEGGETDDGDLIFRAEDEQLLGEATRARTRASSAGFASDGTS